MKAKPYSIRAIENVSERRKRNIENIGSDSVLEKLREIEEKSTESKVFREKYLSKRG